MSHPIDPELAAALAALPPQPDHAALRADAQSGRPGLKQFIAAMKPLLPVLEDIAAEDRVVPGPAGASELQVRVYRPRATTGRLPAVLWIHGGGYVTGSLELESPITQQLAGATPCVVVTPEYRLAPEHPYPAALEDCYAVLRWLVAEADALGIDAGRLAVAGASAGGGLAAALALLARDRGEFRLTFQMLIYPMLDDRNVAPASAAVPDSLLWSRAANRFGWQSYLGREPGADDVSPYAAPARATTLAGLPPAYISVGSADLFLDEDVAYATRLLAAGVPTELHVFPGAYHGFENIAPDAALSKQAVAERDAALQRALKA